MSLWGWICILLCVAPSFICVSVCALRGCLLPVPVSVPICSFVWLPLWLFVCGSVSPMRRILCKHTRVSEREKKDVTLTLSPRYSSAENFYFILFSFFLSFSLSFFLSFSHSFTQWCILNQVPWGGATAPIFRKNGCLAVQLEANQT